MRRVFLAITVAAALAGGAPVYAQSNPFRPVVYVNNSVVTQFDIDQRVRFMQLLRSPDATRETAEKALIDDKLRLNIATQLGIRPTEEQIQAGLAEFAGRGDLSTQQFEQLLTQNNVDPQVFRDFVTAGLVWRDVVRARIAPTVSVSDAEIDQEFIKIAETPKVTSVLLSELIIPAPPGQEAEAKALADRIAANTRSESDFSAAARQYSATPSAQNGGRLNWTPLANLPPTLRPIILGIQPGHVGPALSVEGAVVLFFVRDTRGTVRPGARAQTLDYLRLRLGNPAQAAQISSGLRNCNDLYIAAQNFPADRLIEEKSVSQSAIPSDVALRLATLDADEATLIGGDVLMLCKRAPALMENAQAFDIELAPGAAVPATPRRTPSTPPAADGAEGGTAAAAAAPSEETEAPLPDRIAVRDMVFNRKIQTAADAYLADLRADAIIRRP